MIAYDFFAPAQIVFGWGRRSELAAQSAARTAGSGSCGARERWRARPIGQAMVASLAEAGMTVKPLASISREPTIDDVDRIAKQLRAEVLAASDTVPAFGAAAASASSSGRRSRLAIGGGSAIDLAKAVAALATNRRGRLGARLSGRGRPRPGDRRAAAAGRGRAHDRRHGERGNQECRHFGRPAGLQKKFAVGPDGSQAGAGRSGTDGLGAAGDHGPDRNGRRHAIDRKLIFRAVPDRCRNRWRGGFWGRPCWPCRWRCASRRIAERAR